MDLRKIVVSEEMARTLSMSVTVTKFNSAMVTEWYRSGKVISTTKKDGHLVIERMCMNGDVIVIGEYKYVVNVVKEGHSIGLHPSLTTPHNVDFIE